MKRRVLGIFCLGAKKIEPVLLPRLTETGTVNQEIQPKEYHVKKLVYNSRDAHRPITKRRKDMK